MIGPFTRPSSKFDDEIDRLLEVLNMNDPEEEEYQKVMDRLDQLMKIKTCERPSRISWDTALVVAGNLLGVILVLKYERLHIVTSKAMTMVIRPKQS